jgi:hypothetical protein
MVMSVPYNVKIKVLGRITPPLKDPGPSSPAVQVRGAIIAVEGEDTPAVKELTEWLRDYLAKEREYSPRIADPPQAPDAKIKDVSFQDYLDLIKEWHGKSSEMIKYITTPIPASVSDGEGEGEGEGEGDSDENKDQKSTSSQDLTIKPVLLLPTYQLRASDIYTSRIPIQDAYSPTDHWQWMATLWRGTVGPDLTIYIHSGGDKEGPGPSKLVEVDENVRCVAVRKEKGSKFNDGALRRVGFEVGEWVRSLDARAG